MAHTRERGKRRQREMLGEEAEYKTFHATLLDSSPGGGGQLYSSDPFYRRGK